MKIAFAGQLDRVFANEFAIFVGPESDDHWDLESVEEQRMADRGYFHLAGTLAALSDEIVSLPYVRYAVDSVRDENTAEISEPTAYDQEHLARIHAKMDFESATSEALELANVCALIGQLAKTSDDILDAVDTDEAWIGHYHALKHLHVEDGVPLAYLAGLMLQALHAWKTGAVFVIAECDRLILADLGAMIVRNRWPRPFAIPDLRYLGPPSSKRNCGTLVNLCPADVASVDTLKLDPSVSAYSKSISRIILNGDEQKVSASLNEANQVLQLDSPTHANTNPGISMVLANVRMFSNAGTKTPGGKSDRDSWSHRRFPKRLLRTVVLV